MFMQDFSSPAFDIFSRKFQYFSEEILSEFLKIPNLSMQFDAATNKACSCNPLASAQTDIAKFLTFFQEDFRIFRRILKCFS
jgi:hypothetical protein